MTDHPDARPRCPCGNPVTIDGNTSTGFRNDYHKADVAYHFKCAEERNIVQACKPLDSCPFCGGKAEVRCSAIRCLQCGAQGPSVPEMSLSRQADAWNAQSPRLAIELNRFRCTWSIIMNESFRDNMSYNSPTIRAMLKDLPSIQGEEVDRG